MINSEGQCHLYPTLSRLLRKSLLIQRFLWFYVWQSSEDGVRGTVITLDLAETQWCNVLLFLDSIITLLLLTKQLCCYLHYIISPIIYIMSGHTLQKKQKKNSNIVQAFSYTLAEQLSDPSGYPPSVPTGGPLRLGKFVLTWGGTDYLTND